MLQVFLFFMYVSTLCVHIPTLALWSFDFTYCWFSETGVKEVTAFNNIKVAIREVIWNLKLHCLVTKLSKTKEDKSCILNWTFSGESQIEKEEIGKLKLDYLSSRQKKIGKIYDVCLRISRIFPVKLLSDFKFRKRRNFLGWILKNRATYHRLITCHSSD